MHRCLELKKEDYHFLLQILTYLRKDHQQDTFLKMKLMRVFNLECTSLVFIYKSLKKLSATKEITWQLKILCSTRASKLLRPTIALDNLADWKELKVMKFLTCLESIQGCRIMNLTQLQTKGMREQLQILLMSTRSLPQFTKNSRTPPRWSRIG